MERLHSSGHIILESLEKIGYIVTFPDIATERTQNDARESVMKDFVSHQTETAAEKGAKMRSGNRKNSTNTGDSEQTGNRFSGDFSENDERGTGFWNIENPANTGVSERTRNRFLEQYIDNNIYNIHTSRKKDREASILGNPDNYILESAAADTEAKTAEGREMLIRSLMETMTKGQQADFLQSVSATMTAEEIKCRAKAIVTAADKM